MPHNCKCNAKCKHIGCHCDFHRPNWNKSDTINLNNNIDTYFIYSVNHPTYGVLYIGKTNESLKDTRWKVHKTGWNKYNRTKGTEEETRVHKYYRFVDDWSEIEFHIEETLEHVAEQKALEREQSLIQFYELTTEQRLSGTRKHNPNRTNYHREASLKYYNEKIKGKSTRCECGGKINLNASPALQRHHSTSKRHCKWMESISSDLE